MSDGKKKVFIDGSAGTTGLRIRTRLASRADLELVTLPEELRKDASARADALNSADIAFLCLPDAAAIEAVGLVESPTVTIIDTSTAHRVSPGWEYGFAELAGRRERIRSSRRIANPGCHASGFIALVEPLVRAGVIAPSARLCAFSLTGYSGGGKKMIAEYESGNIAGAAAYALAQSHKHLPEMVKICGLEAAPAFSPIVIPHYSGMETSVMLHADAVKGGLAAMEECLRDYYSAPGLVAFRPAAELPERLYSDALSGRDDMLVTVHGNDERIVLTALFDNLGKGASGAAIQNMNLALGVREDEGLVRGS